MLASAVAAAATALSQAMPATTAAVTPLLGGSEQLLLMAQPKRNIK